MDSTWKLVNRLKTLHLSCVTRNNASKEIPVFNVFTVFVCRTPVVFFPNSPSCLLVLICDINWTDGLTLQQKTIEQ